MNVGILNAKKERLDAVTEGTDGDLTIVMAHGFGTSKDENARLFIDISQELSQKARIVRFDFSGYGQSEGQQEDVDLNTMADDLFSVISWVRGTFGGRVMIIAHSLGTLVTRVLSPDHIEKIIFTGVTRPDAKAHLASTMKRLQGRPGGVLNEHGVSIYPRKDGSIQKIGSNYWKILRSVDPLKLMADLANKTNLIIIKPKQDEMVRGVEATNAYKNIPNLTYLELDGDHNFTSRQDRVGLLKTVSRLIP